MRNKKTFLILGVLLLTAVAFVYNSLNTGQNSNDIESPMAYFTTQGNILVSYQKVFIGTIKVQPDQTQVEVLINDSLVLKKFKPEPTISFEIPIKNLPLGAYRLRVISRNSEGLSSEDERVLYVVSDLVPENWAVEPLQKLPHNDSSFTQGLCFYKNSFFEGTGDPKTIGATMVAEVDLNSGKIVKRRTKPQPVFGEGITVKDGELYQISWKNDSCFVYNSTTLKPIRSYTYTGEGWGLTHDGTSLIMSDGSEKIYFRDPKSFKVTKVIAVYTHQGPINYLNELEYIDGLIYANIWMSNLIAAIDPKTGRVIATIDATNLVKEGKGNGEVLNGIAYNPTNKKTYLTGKYWPSLFEVNIKKPKG